MTSIVDSSVIAYIERIIWVDILQTKMQTRLKGFSPWAHIEILGLGLELGKTNPRAPKNPSLLVHKKSFKIGLFYFGNNLQYKQLP